MPAGIYKHKPHQGFQKGHTFYKGGEKGWFKKGSSPSFTPFQKGHKSWNLGKRWSGKIRRKISESVSKIAPKGKNHPRWKGGYKNKLMLSKKRRAIKRGALGSHTLGEWELLKIQYGYTCPCCGRSEPDIKLTEDHIIPLSKGGSDNIENIQPLCLSCNCKKHTKIIRYDRS